jgi:pimeloyl-ACP methyl ester carboxylesterase
MISVTSRDGTTIAFDRTGEGPPTILVGGALSDRSASSPLATTLAPRFTVVTYDRRGRGGSGDTPPYAVEREVEDLEALTDEAGGSAFVFGHSSGAVLALEAAARGVAIRKLALYEPPFVVDDSRAPVPEDYVQTLTRLTAEGRRGDAIEYFMTEAVGVPREAVAEMRGAPYWPSMEAVAHTLAYDGAVMGDTIGGTSSPIERWASVTTPTLVVDGGASPTWARNAVETLVDTLPDARRRTLEGQTHDVDPEVLAPVLKEFFAG